MRRIRVIPVLLIKKGALYKSVKFKSYNYIGDPINAVKIFNEKEVDEIVILDIDASAENRPPNFEQIRDIAGEAFMPLAYGGGISTLEQVKKILYEGVEKVVFNKSATENYALIEDTARQFGSSSVVISIDVKKDLFGRSKVFIMNGKKNTGLDPVTFAKQMENLGAGEIFLTSIDKDGTFEGFDNKLTATIANEISIPVIASGGAGSLDDFYEGIIIGHASAVAAGSMFIYQQPHKAVLISYPTQAELVKNLYSKI